MFLTIVLRKEVPDEATAQILYDIIKTKLEDQPEVEITGQVNNVLIDAKP